MKDYADKLWLNQSSHDAKREAAIAWLGERYVLHESRNVAKLSEPLMLERTMEPKVLRGRK